ncbi:MAG: D-alanyl-D-alanine carboxypeptidase/D-alanyl-D-alanine endopeptidase [Acidimicrobiales bacterium]
MGAVAAGGVVWRTEASAPGPAEGTTPGQPQLATPVLSVRRLPTVVAAPIAERRLRLDLEAWAAQAPGDSCAVVRNDESVVFEQRPDDALVPASTTKLLTATAVLLQLGPDERLTTRVVATAPVVDGVVPGDLVLVGGGDPLLATADYMARFRNQPQTFTDLDALAASVEAAGVRRVEGAVVGDETRYDQERYVAGWPVRYLNQNVIGPLSALAVNDGFAAYPTPGATDVPLEPADHPAVNAAAVLTRLLVARGIEVVGEPRAGAAPAEFQELAAIESPPMAQVLAQLLTESDNSTGELLLKELGARAGAGTTAAGRERARALLDLAEIDVGGAVVADGSGLSLDNRASCSLLVDLLERPDTGPVLDAGLAVAGESGTLSRRFSGTDLEGRLRGKTGSLNTVTALAGVVQDDDPPLTFAYVVNAPPPGPVPEGVAASQQALGEILLAWPRVPDSTVLGPMPAGGR